MNDNQIKETLINYAILRKEIDAINKRIGKHLYKSWENLPPDTEYDNVKHYWLSKAYAGGYQRDEGFMFINHSDDVEGYLEENCLEALAAHRLIQQRKPLKKEFGRAKAKLTKLSFHLLKKSLESPQVGCQDLNTDKQE
jgi:hypothetical protein